MRRKRNIAGELSRILFWPQNLMSQRQAPCYWQRDIVLIVDAVLFSDRSLTRCYYCIFYC